MLFGQRTLLAHPLLAASTHGGWPISLRCGSIAAAARLGPIELSPFPRCPIRFIFKALNLSARPF